MRLARIGPGHAELTMTVRADMLNGHAICHGGFIFTLADSAFAFACNSYNLNTVASGCTIDFLAPAREGDVLTAIAQERSVAAATASTTSTSQPARRADRAVPRQELPDQGARGRRAAGLETRPRAVDRIVRPKRRPHRHARQEAPSRRARADREREPRRTDRAAAGAPALVAQARLRQRAALPPRVRCRRRASERPAHARRPRAVSVHDQGGPARQLPLRDVRRAARPRSCAFTRRRERPASRRSSAIRATTSTPGRP